MNSQLHKKWTNRWENQQSQNVLEKINKIEKSPARLIKKKKKEKRGKLSKLGMKSCHLYRH